MKVYTLTFDKESGWSSDFPNIDSHKVLILVFGAPQYLDYPQPIQELKKAYPTAKISGCSTSGEIHQAKVSDDSLSVAIIQFDSTDIKVVSEPISNPQQSAQAGKKLADLLNGPNLTHVILLSDGLNVNGSDLVRSINQNLNSNDVTVSGGLAGDGSDFNTTWILDNDNPNPSSQLIAAIGLYGDSLVVGCGSKGGWDTFGPERTITRSKGNIVYEIDGEPALDLYKKYLGSKADELPASALLFPLTIRETMISEAKLVRTILSVDEQAKSMTFAGDIPEGWCAQLMRSNADRLIDGAIEAGMQTTKNKPDNTDTLALAISCVGRRLVLGERCEEETEATLSVLPTNTKQIGFYSYGEISPTELGFADLHNQTMTLTILSEKNK